MEPTRVRLRNIDLFKGLLIILVILGHVIQGEKDEVIWRTIIYSFHMPLFIGISGFLLNADKIASLNLLALIRKYFLRAILPWAIAVVIYFAFLVWQDPGISLVKGLIGSFLIPFHHLWFIPGFLSWIILTWLFKKIKTNDTALLIIALLISVVSIVLENYPELYEDSAMLNSFIGKILHTFRPYFYFFFVLGSVCKGLKLKRPELPEYILPLLGLALVIYLFYNPVRSLSTINFFLFNSLLLSLVLKVSAHDLIGVNKRIEWLGLHSLAIYLWHVIPILISKVFIGTENLALFYLMTLGLELILIGVYKYLLRVETLRKYVFGM